MLIRPTRFCLMALLPSLLACADSAVYVVDINSQFGTLDLNTGAFNQIGPNTPEGETGLVPGPDGSLLTLTYSGNLDSINPATGAVTVIGPTGLANCSSPASPCGPNSAGTLGAVDGKFYATDFQNNLYSVNPYTGHAMLIGRTGLPAVPFIPGTVNPNGSFDFYDPGLLGIGGKLFATFDAGIFNPATSSNQVVIAPELYSIDPATGLSTLIGSTALGLDALAGIDGSIYAFSGTSNQILTLNPANGATRVVGSIDHSAGVIAGAAPVPEPASIAVTACGLFLLVLAWRRGRTAGS